MKSIYKLIFISILIALIGCSKDSNDNPTEPDTGLKIIIDPIEQNINVGDEEYFYVKIENVSNLFAISAEIKFDETMILIPDNSFTVEDFWSSGTISECIYESDRLNVCIGLVQSSETDGISGSGNLFGFKLFGENPGISGIEIHNLHLIDENGTMVANFDEIIISNGSLEINE